MAGLTTPCARCGFGVPPRALICPRCAADVSAAELETMPLEVALPEVPATPPAAPPVAPPVAQPATCPGCRRALTGPVCAFCNWSAEQAGAQVRLPNGAMIALQPDRPFDLGRDCPDATVAAVLQGYPGVSRRHARLVLSGRQVTVIDLRSTNGTFVDGTEVVDPVTVPLFRPVEIRLGQRACLEVRPDD